MEAEPAKWFGAPAPHNRHFVLFLPSRDRHGQAIRDFEKLSDMTARILCGLFGGVTSYPATGVFQRQSGTLQKEAVVVQECFCDEQTWQEQSSAVRRLVETLSGLLDQESVACSLDGEMTFVPPTATDFRLNGEIDDRTLANWLSGRMTDEAD